METTETRVGEVEAGTTIKSPQKRHKRKWKMVEVKYSFPDTYSIFSEGKCIATVYFKPKAIADFKPNAQKPTVQLVRENIENVEIRGEDKVTRIMKVEEAEPYARSECPYCMVNMAFAKEKGWRVIVDMSNRDIIGVEVPPENQGGS